MQGGVIGGPPIIFGPANEPVGGVIAQVSGLAGDRLTIYRKQPDGCWLQARDAHTLTAVTNPGP